MVDGLADALQRYRDYRRRHWRIRLLAVIAILAVVAGLMFHKAERDSSTEIHAADPTTRVRSDGTTVEPECAVPAQRRPLTIDRLNAVIGGSDLPYLQAGDVGTSGQLSDGRLLWAFGDTVRKPGVVPNLVANSIAVSRGTCLAQVLVKRPRFTQPGPVIADRADGAVYWPNSLVVLRGTSVDEVVIFAARIKRQGSGAFDFTQVGADAFRMRVPHGGVPSLHEHIELTPDGADAASWGGASTVRDGQLYVFGTRDAFGGSRPVLVGRAPVDALTDRRRWRFWDGSAWVADHRSAKDVLAPGDGVSQTFSADVIGGRFVLASKCGGDFGDTVCAWTSQEAVGPWTRSRQVRVPFRDGSTFQYAPLAHPEIPLVDGKLAVSYSRNTDNLSALIRDPRLGRPTFVEIDWPR